MNVLSPYEAIPTEELYFTSPEQQHQRPQLPLEEIPRAAAYIGGVGSTSISSVSSVGVVRAHTAARELDEESGERILDYIYRKGGGSVAVKKNSSPAPVMTLDPNGHTNSFYIPPAPTPSLSGGRGGGGGGFLDLLTDKLGLKTKANIQRIDKTVLVKNGVTLGVLIEECGVAISNLRQANILNTFEDLLDLGFCAEDLTRNRLLFSCQSFKQVFKADYHTMVRHGVPFDVSHLLKCKFTPQELDTLNYSLDTLIQAGGIDRDLLMKLNFSLADLVQLHFRGEHLKMLKISRRLATAPRPRGFGWSADDLSLITDVSDK
jgi:hypothetical protein